MGFSRRCRQENSSEHSSGGTDINGEVNEESKKAAIVRIVLAEEDEHSLIEYTHIAQ